MFLPVPQLVLDHHLKTLQPLMQQWSQRFPPVLLFTGPRGVGKRSMIHFIAQWAFCEKSPFSRASQDTLSFFEYKVDPPATPSFFPCQICGPCQKAIRNQWVDFIEISPQSTEDKKEGSLKIEDFRNLKTAISFKPYESPYKIVHIHEAETLTIQAANSLLKILEEPPQQWLFFLSTHDSSLLIPTLLSRCQQIRLKPFSDQEIEGLLNQNPTIKDLPADRKTICARLAQGSWKKALALAEDEYWNKRQSLFQFLETPSLKIEELIDWAAQDSKHLSLLMDHFEGLTAELITWSVQKDQHYQWINSDGQNAILFHGKKAIKYYGTLEGARQYWMERAREVQEIRKKLKASANRKILIQDLLLPWLEL